MVSVSQHVNGAFSRPVIERFAQDVGVAPGIVMGRLQHETRIRRHIALNSLKVHYRWSAGPAAGAQADNNCGQIEYSTY